MKARKSISYTLSLLLLVSVLCFGGLLWIANAGRYSMDDPLYFQEKPKIVLRDGKYFVEWVYGSYGFYFYPEVKLKGDHVVCSLSGTTSSGARTGRKGAIEVKIKNDAMRQLIEKGEVFWREPDGNLVRLAVRSASEDEISGEKRGSAE